MKKTASKRPSLTINAMSNYVSLALNIVLGFVLTPFIIDQVEKSGYGIWILIGSIVGYYGLLDLGVSSAITRFVARYAGQGEEESLNRTASTAMGIFVTIGILVILLSFILGSSVSRFFNLSGNRLVEFKYMFWVLGFAAGIGFPGNVFGAIIGAHERYVHLNIIKITKRASRAIMVVVLLLSGYGLIGIAFATLFSELLGLAISIFIFFRVIPDVVLSTSLIDRTFMLKLFKYGGITTVILLADQVRINLDSLVIAKWLNVSSVGVYNIAFLLISYMMTLIITGIDVFRPRFASLDGSNDKEGLRKSFLNSLKMSSFLSFGACMGVIIFGGSFIKFWVGGEFHDSILILLILSVPFALDLAQNPSIILMYAMNKHHYYAIFTVLEAIANLVLSIALVVRYGMVGVALGTAIPMVIVKLFVQPVYVNRITGISLADYAKAIIPSAIVASLVVLASFLIGLPSYGSLGLTKFVASVATISFIYVLMSVMTTFKKEAALYIGNSAFKKNIMSAD